MNKALLIGIVLLTGCAENYTPNTLPPVNPELLAAPCKLLPPAANSDEDLTIDVQNAECTRQLRLKVYRLQDWVKNVTGDK